MLASTTPPQNAPTTPLEMNDLEPDDEWKERLRAQIKENVQAMVDHATNDYDGELRQSPEQERQLKQEHRRTLATLAASAEAQYRLELANERQQRRWAAGYSLESRWINTLREQQEVIYQQIQQDKNRESPMEYRGPAQPTPPVHEPMSMSHPAVPPPQPPLPEPITIHATPSELKGKNIRQETETTGVSYPFPNHSYGRTSASQSASLSRPIQQPPIERASPVWDQRAVSPPSPMYKIWMPQSYVALEEDAKTNRHSNGKQSMRSMPSIGSRHVVTTNLIPERGGFDEPVEDDPDTVASRILRDTNAIKEELQRQERVKQQWDEINQARQNRDSRGGGGSEEIHIYDAHRSHTPTVGQLPPDVDPSNVRESTRSGTIPEEGPTGYPGGRSSMTAEPKKHRSSKKSFAPVARPVLPGNGENGYYGQRVDQEKEKEVGERNLEWEREFERERAEKDVLDRERERLDKERLRVEQEKLEREKEKQKQLKRKQLEKDREEKEKLEREKERRERLEREQLERDREESFEREKERLGQLKREQLERDREEQERLEREKERREQLERELLERKRLAAELETERLERKRLAAELEKVKREQAEHQRLQERERTEREQRDRLEEDRRQREREKERDREKRERERKEKEDEDIRKQFEEARQKAEEALRVGREAQISKHIAEAQIERERRQREREKGSSSSRASGSTGSQHHSTTGSTLTDATYPSRHRTAYIPNTAQPISVRNGNGPPSQDQPWKRRIQDGTYPQQLFTAPPGARAFAYERGDPFHQVDTGIQRSNLPSTSIQASSRIGRNRYTNPHAPRPPASGQHEETPVSGGSQQQVSRRVVPNSSSTNTARTAARTRLQRPPSGVSLDRPMTMFSYQSSAYDDSSPTPTMSLSPAFVNSDLPSENWH